MNEVIPKLCKVCGEVKEAIFNGFYGDGKTRKYVNRTGQLWNGTWCPECNIIRVRIKMQEIRSKRKK